MICLFIFFEGKKCLHISQVEVSHKKSENCVRFEAIYTKLFSFVTAASQKKAPDVLHAKRQSE